MLFNIFDFFYSLPIGELELGVTKKMSLRFGTCLCIGCQAFFFFFSAAVSGIVFFYRSNLTIILKFSVSKLYPRECLMDGFSSRLVFS